MVRRCMLFFLASIACASHRVPLGSEFGSDSGSTPCDGDACPTDTGPQHFQDSRTDTMDVPPPPHPLFDWIGVIGTGQSLSVGAAASFATTTEPFQNLKLVDQGPDPKYPLNPDPKTWTTAPLAEPIRPIVAGTGPGYGDGQYPNDLFGETPHTHMANTLSALWQARGGAGSYITAHSVVGWSGHVLADIDKQGGGRAYPASLAEARVWTQLAKNAGKTFGYGGIILTHGESDALNVSYEAGLFKLITDYNKDLKAITGQSNDVILFVSQQSTLDATSAVEVWQAGVDHPDKIVCVGPKYQYAYADDNLHMAAPGYDRLGGKYAEVFDAVVNQKVAWRPLQPNHASKVGALITLDFDVPVPPLAWDAHIPARHQIDNSEWAAGRGFEATGSLGSRLTISSVAIHGTSVDITLASVPSGPVNVSYATTQDGPSYPFHGGTALGFGGQLRDSDELVAFDAESLNVKVTQGSPVITSTVPGQFSRRAAHDIVQGGTSIDLVVQSHDSDDQLTLSSPWTNPGGTAALSFHHDERNYLVAFKMLVN